MEHLLDVGCAEADKSFGPVIPPSCRAFDFTLLFEHVFFSIVPATALLVTALFRFWQLRHAQAAAFGLGLQVAKQVVIFCYAATQLASLIVWSTSTYRTDASVASAVFTFLASLLMCPLSYFEGLRSARPSAVLNVYLFGTCLFECAQVRTLWLSGLHNLGLASSVGLGTKLVLLVLEALPKTTFNAEEGMNISREDKAGIYSLRSFWWVNRILLLGRRHSLKHADLDDIGPGLRTIRYSSDLTYNWDLDTDVHGKKYGLILAVFCTLKWPLLAPGIPRLILIGFNFAQPLLIRRALDFVAEANGQSNENNIGYGLIGATLFVYTGLAVFNGYYNHLLYRSIILVRGSLVDIIYQKSLNIELSVAQKAAPAGLVTADVEKIDFTIEKLHAIWASIVELAIGVYLLQQQVGWACIAPALVALACTIATSIVSKMLPKRQKAWNQQVQKRVALTSTMLSNMKTAKMMGLSQYIVTTLQAARMVELAASAGFRRCMAIVNTIVLVPRQLSTPITLTLFVLAVRNEKLTASVAFTAISLIEIITTPLTLLLQALPSITTSLACLDRIQDYLKSPDRLDLRRNRDHTQSLDKNIHDISDTSIDRIRPNYDDIANLVSEKLEITVNDHSALPSVAIRFQNASLFYDATNPGNHVLGSVSWTVPHGTITLVVGPPGSGKSALLKAILGEINVKGELHVRSGSIAFCDQSPWIPNESAKSCIIGMSDAAFDYEWYEEVVYTCGLGQEGDLCSETQCSDAKAVGSRGSTLSEGQKQRLALARAIYSRSPLLILDDIFRSLDQQTENLISERLLSPTHGLLKRHGMTAVLASHSTRQNLYADQVVVLGDGKLTRVDDLTNLNDNCGDAPAQHAQRLGHSDEEKALVAPEFIVGNTGTAAPASQKLETTPKKVATSSALNLGARGIGTRKTSTYRFYLRPVGVFQAGVLVTAVVMLAFSTRFQRIWVGWWTDAAASLDAMYIGVYFFLAGGACLSFMFFFWWMFVVVVPITAGALHLQLLRSVLGAPLSYFTTVDSGVILNRFSQDMAIVNGMLPVSVFQATSSAVMVLSQIATVAYGSKYMAVSIPFTLIVLGILAQFYLRTSQQLRILDIELKAPIYTGLTETKEGLATIRAFGWQAAYKRHCQSRIDDSKRAIYMLFMVQRWLNFVLDLIVAGLATVLMAIATQLRNSMDAAALGVGLSSIIGFSTLTSQFIMAYTELENSLGAVARIEDCVETIQSEDADAERSLSGLQEAPQGWPNDGGINLSHVTAVYDDTENPALSDVSFRVQPGQKVLVCGRTGSGKSTLILALLRLVGLHGDASQVLIDGLNISTLRAETVRRGFAIVPQMPFFLPGSVRLNLTAASGTGVDEAMLITALTKVGLWSLVAERGGLDADIAAVALSHGQQQLFSLATAILRKRKGSIVLLDEATSGVDDATEKKMYDLIEDVFRDCTVIAVAHRLKRPATVCDMVIVLSGGKVVEIGHPQDLVEARGEFFHMLEA